MDKTTVSVVQEFIKAGINQTMHFTDLKNQVKIDDEAAIKNSLQLLSEKDIIQGCYTSGYRLNVESTYKH